MEKKLLCRGPLEITKYVGVRLNKGYELLLFLKNILKILIISLFFIFFYILKFSN